MTRSYNADSPAQGTRPYSDQEWARHIRRLRHTIYAFPSSSEPSRDINGSSVETSSHHHGDSSRGEQRLSDPATIERQSQSTPHPLTDRITAVMDASAIRAGAVPPRRHHLDPSFAQGQSWAPVQPPGRPFVDDAVPIRRIRSLPQSFGSALRRSFESLRRLGRTEPEPLAHRFQEFNTSELEPIPMLITIKGSSLQPVSFYSYDREHPYFGFSTFSPHAIVYDGKRYPTVLHLHQSLKVCTYLRTYIPNSAEGSLVPTSSAGYRRTRTQVGG